MKKQKNKKANDELIKILEYNEFFKGNDYFKIFYGFYRRLKPTEK